MPDSAKLSGRNKPTTGEIREAAAESQDLSGSSVLADTKIRIHKRKRKEAE